MQQAICKQSAKQSKRKSDRTKVKLAFKPFTIESNEDFHTTMDNSNRRNNATNHRNNIMQKIQICTLIAHERNIIKSTVPLCEKVTRTKRQL